MTEPTDTPVHEPGPATIEIVERHPGPRLPETGPGSVLMPNHVRINGVALYATIDYPVRIREIEISGDQGSPFAVTVQVLARALFIGTTPAFEPGAEAGADDPVGAIVEIPSTGGLAAGAVVEQPYVLLNGKRIYIQGGIGIGEMATDGEGRNAAVVTMTLLCRRLVVDDEPADE